MPVERATAIAAAIGQAAAVLFALAGLVSGNLLLVLIALFVYIGAAQEAGAQRQAVAVRGHVAREAIAFLSVGHFGEALPSGRRDFVGTQLEGHLGA